MANRISVFIISAIFLLNSACFANDVEKEIIKGEPVSQKELFIASAAQERVLEIGLVDCVTYALGNNSEIRIKRIEPRLKEADIRVAQSAFEPSFNATYNLQDTSSISPNSSLFSPGVSTSRTTEFNAGLQGKLPTGTEYSIDFLNKKYESNAAYQVINPYYTAEPKITITQPLFRDFGILVNRADIIIAQNNMRESKESFKETVMDIVTRTKSAYYNYIFWLENYSIAELSLKRAEDLLEINKARYAKGLVSSVDLLETETAVAQRKKALITAESNLKRAEDELKLITNLVDDPEIWNAEIKLIDKPEFKVQEVNLIQSLRNAFKYRPDYISQKIDLKNRDVKVKVAKNALLPTIDLVGSFGLNGLGQDYQQAIDKISPDYKDWSVGVKFSLPWGSGERVKHEQRKLEKVQALLAFKRLEQNIILEVRDRVREVDIQHRQVQAAGLSKEKEAKNYQAQKERYAAGQISTHDVLDYQDKLAQAELDYIRALIDYNIALINLEEAEGLTLVKNNIILEE